MLKTFCFFYIFRAIFAKTLILTRFACSPKSPRPDFRTIDSFLDWTCPGFRTIHSFPDAHDKFFACVCGGVGSNMPPLSQIADIARNGAGRISAQSIHS